MKKYNVVLKHAGKNINAVAEIVQASGNLSKDFAFSFVSRAPVTVLAGTNQKAGQKLTMALAKAGAEVELVQVFETD